VNGLHPHSIAVSSDGRYLLAIETPAAYLETRVKIWDTLTWQEAVTLKIPSTSPINCLAFTPDNRYLIAAANGMMKILVIGSWQEVMTLPSSDDVRAMAVTPDGKYVITGMNVWQVDWSCLPE
jgi:WD40 repeat protein